MERVQGPVEDDLGALHAWIEAGQPVIEPRYVPSCNSTPDPIGPPPAPTDHWRPTRRDEFEFFSYI